MKIVIPTRFMNLPAARKQFGDRVDRLAPFLLRGDPLADDVIEEMRGMPPGQGFGLVNEILANPHFPAAQRPPAIRTFFEHLDHVPAWVDWNAMRRGNELLLRSGILGGIVLAAESLAFGYASPAGNKPLVFSGQLKERAPRRLAETSRFVQAVAQYDGFRRTGDAFAITVRVRLMHAQVRSMLRKSPMWKTDQWGEPINQHDMAATILLFSLVFMVGVRKLGLETDPEEADSFMHLWRYGGHLMGVDPEILPTSEFDGWGLAQLIRSTQGPPDEDSRTLTAALFNASLQNAKTPEEIRLGTFRREMGHGFCRQLLGADLANQLGVPRTPAESAYFVFRAAARAGEAARKRSPELHRRMVASGANYWERVVKDGLGTMPADFKPPTKLAREV